MNYFTSEIVQQHIIEFKERIKIEPDYCRQLFKEQTIRVMAAKYAYYKTDRQFLTDAAYDTAEKCWYIMGRALGVLNEDETSPCIDYDEKHEYANEGKELAMKFIS